MNIRCLQIITRMYTGGAEEAVLQLIRHLAKYDVQCDLAVGNVLKKDVLKKFPFPQSCSVFQIPYLQRNPHPIKDIQAIQQLKQLIQENNYSIVHTHTAKAGILGRYAAHKTNITNIIHTVHTLTFGNTFNFISRMLYKTLEKWANKFTKHFIFVSRDLQDKYLQANITTEKKASTIYVGMELQQFRKTTATSNNKKIQLRQQLSLPNDLDEIMLACIARVTPTKKQETLIRLFPHILKKHPKTHLLFFGTIDKDYHKKLLSLCHALSISNKVHFLGFQPQLWKYISIIDVHCFSSIHEGLPLVLVQCSAAGIPSVCFRCSGIEEIIIHKKSGFIFEHNQKKQFIHSLLSLIQDKEKRKNFSKQAQICSYGNKFSNWDMLHYAQSTKELYAQLIQQSS